MNLIERLLHMLTKWELSLIVPKCGINYCDAYGRAKRKDELLKELVEDRNNYGKIIDFLAEKLNDPNYKL